MDQIAVHFVLENSLEYQDSSEDENSNAEEDQPDGWLSLKHAPNVLKIKLKSVPVLLHSYT